MGAVGRCAIVTREVPKLIEPAARRQVIGCVFAHRRLSDLDLGGDALKRARYFLRVLASGLIGVGDDRHLRAAQVVGVLRPPLTSTAAVASADLAGSLNGVNILLALRDPDTLAAAHGRAHPRQAVEHAPGPAELPGRSRPCRPACAAQSPSG